jgi:hypothetical protein
LHADRVVLLHRVASRRYYDVTILGAHTHYTQRGNDMITFVTTTIAILSPTQKGHKTLAKKPVATALYATAHQNGLPFLQM